MKKLFLALITALSLFSCSTADIVEDDIQQNIEMTTGYQYVSFTPTFDVQTEQIVTRAIESNQQVYIKAYDVYDGNVVSVYDGGQITFPSFPNVSFKSKYGKHKFVFIVSAKKPLDTTFPIDFEKVNDVLLGELDIDINANTNSTQTVSLKRITSKLTFVMTDDPSMAKDLSQIVITSKDQNMLIDILGESVSLQSSGDLTVNIDASTASELLKSGSLSIVTYLFTLTDEDKFVDVNIKFLDSTGNILAQYDLANLPFKRNYTTTVKGKFLGDQSSFNFNYDTEWKEDNNLIFQLGNYIN